MGTITPLLGERRAATVSGFVSASCGGGSILFDGDQKIETASIYPHSTFTDIAEYCDQNGLRFPDYVEMVEGKDMFNYLSDIWLVMKSCIDRLFDRAYLKIGNKRVAIVRDEKLTDTNIRENRTTATKK